MSDVIDTLLLLALPASGKSEVRKYLEKLSPEKCRADFGVGPNVQLDDFPYVHFLRRVDDVLEKLGRPRLFYHGPERGFREGRDWGTLIELVNQDREALETRPAVPPKGARAKLLLARIDEAGMKAGIKPRLAALDGKSRTAVADALDHEAGDLLRGLADARPESLKDRTIVIEFARGGPEGSTMPLPAPFGYAYSLAMLSPRILEHASVLYIWVTPEESRRKNVARANPDDPGSILHHGVPESVMRGDYGCDDLEWLLGQSDRPGSIRITAHGKTWYLPVGRFDNRVDRTSFIRADPKQWAAPDVKNLHDGLRQAFDALRR
ncbi:MAG: hypothetical protein HY907_07000 [Deltaproteobacteria bacterium]|nr:hypothetical protein [Deltaproteobacteria bacterium]